MQVIDVNAHDGINVGLRLGMWNQIQEVLLFRNGRTLMDRNVHNQIHAPELKPTCHEHRLHDDNGMHTHTLFHMSTYDEKGLLYVTFTLYSIREGHEVGRSIYQVRKLEFL